MLTAWGWLAPTASRASTAGPSRPPYSVGETVLHFTDPTRTIQYPGHNVAPRSLVTVVRYPRGEKGPFPLIVFGHGFAVIPATYWRLLQAWAQAGFVVAAPVFPGEQKWAPGGPTQTDLTNEPRDFSVVITRMVAASRATGGRLSGLINPSQIAVSGQSDGAIAALAVAANRAYRDRRIKAAVTMAGAEFGSQHGLYFPSRSPALLAMQGTGDMVNNPINTYRYFAAARRPKYLLKLLGAPHLPPFTTEQPQLSIVEQTSIDFLHRYLQGDRAAARRMARAGQRPGKASLIARP